MKLQLKRIDTVYQFTESFARNERSTPYSFWVEKSIALQEKLKPIIQEQTLERDSFMMKYATKDKSGSLVYSDVPHSKHPYKYTPDNLMALEKELIQHANESATKEYEIPIDEKDLIGKENTEAIPVFFNPIIVGLYRDLLICSCVIKLDGSINRSEEQVRKIETNLGGNTPKAKA